MIHLVLAAMEWNGHSNPAGLTIPDGIEWALHSSWNGMTIYSSQNGMTSFHSNLIILRNMRPGKYSMESMRTNTPTQFVRIYVRCGWLGIKIFH